MDTNTDTPDTIEIDCDAFDHRTAVAIGTDRAKIRSAANDPQAAGVDVRTGRIIDEDGSGWTVEFDTPVR